MAPKKMIILFRDEGGQNDAKGYDNFLAFGIEQGEGGMVWIEKMANVALTGDQLLGLIFTLLDQAHNYLQGMIGQSIILDFKERGGHDQGS